MPISHEAASARARKGWETRRKNGNVSASKSSYDRQLRAYRTEYERLAAKFKRDIHGQNRREVYRETSELRSKIANLKRAAETRNQVAQADTLWHIVWDLGAAARNNPETTERWLATHSVEAQTRKPPTKKRS